MILLKKTKSRLDRENRRILKRNRIMEIRQLLENEHYSERAVAMTLGISRNTVRRVREGDIELLCRSGGNYTSRLDQYTTPITEWLIQGKQFKEIRILLQQTFGVAMGISQVSAYCAEIKKSLDINQQRPTPGRFVSRQDVFRHIWSDQSMDEQDWQDICRKYPALPKLNTIIHEFQQALHDHDADQLTRWTEQYGNSCFSHIKSFINGLNRDWIAVKNGFTYAYNSGFVEGAINKLKTEKRMMYGRAGYALLRAKLLAPYYQRKAG